MDYQQIFSDEELKEEFLEKFTEFQQMGSGGLESLERGRPSIDDATAAISAMSEGSWDSRSNPELEAIIRRFARPVYLVQDSTFTSPADGFDDSERLGTRLRSARAEIDNAIPSSGRIDLRNHRKKWVGTGWHVAPGVVATNRHVADEFARKDGNGFAFRRSFEDRKVHATLDWYREHQRGTESRFRVIEVIWIEPEPSFDVALLRIEEHGEEGEERPSVIDLADQAVLTNGFGRWVGVIGYPAQDSRNDAQDQQRIFDGIYDVKRLSPGQITSVREDGLLTHDATTLGGNSGSVVLDLETGRALGIHFGGIQEKNNFAVQSDQLAQIIQNHT